MQQQKKLLIDEIIGDMKTYMNWSVNAIMPVNPKAGDILLKQNRPTIVKVAQKLLKKVNHVTSPLFRGILLRQPVDVILPLEELQYLSFSTDRAVANHFADFNGFGSDVLDVEKQLGKYGYVIEYTPKPEEILFHYRFFSFLPYAEVFTKMGMDGTGEVESLKRQKEIMILQPAEPFRNITKQF